MKVQEIIIDESASSTIASLIGGLGKPVAKSIGKMFGSERSQLVKAISDSLASKGKWAGKATPTEAYGVAKGLGKEARVLVKQDPSILADAAKEANKIRGVSKVAKAGKVAAGTWKGTKSLAGMSGTLVKIGFNVATADAILAPISDYYKVMEVADQWLQAGQIPPQFEGQFASVEDWYKKYREQQLTGAISKTAVALTAISFARIPAGVASKFLSFVGLKGAAAAASAVGAGAGALLAQGLKDSELSNGIAHLLASDPMGIPTSGIIGGISASVLDSKLGSIFSAAGKVGVAAYDAGRSGYDAVTGGGKKASAEPADGGSQSAKPSANQADAGAKADKDATSDAKKPATQEPAKNLSSTGYELAPNASPINKWIDIGNGFVKDPATGQIADRYALGLQ